MIKISLLIFCFLISFNANALAIENTLKDHASPYLAMHGDDPVAWQEWNKKTVKRAQKEGKLIFVSSGYFSCHWCHVMQRESYQNKDVAEILNTYFIPVKVDREINSALDSHLIDFVERTQGHAGWPLNVFITPDGYPLVGMTYVPTQNFLKVLNNLTTRWKEEKAELEQIAINATHEILTSKKSGNQNLKPGLGQDYINRFLSQASAMADDLSGGFGEQNKFPSVPQLNVLLTAYKNKPDDTLKQFLLLSLNKMASQGLNDQLSGGFFRYTVDPLWQTPHFEKMLYDNALLASLYMDAAKILNNKKFEKVAKDTLDFMLDTFLSNQGVFIASLSALDSENIEGGYYLWQRDELKNILNIRELKLVELIWKLDGAAELSAGYHFAEVMNINEAAKILKISPETATSRFDSAKNKLLNVRKKRNVPRDTKLLAAWNGLALSAFSKAAKKFNNKRYAEAAKNIKDYIYQNLWEGKTLVRAVKEGIVLGAAGLEDYSYLALGLYDWIEYSRNQSDLSNQEDLLWLQELLEQTWNRFYSKQGWRLTENSLLKYGQGEAVIADSVMPSASAIIINISLNAGGKNKTTELKEKALMALSAGHAEIVSQPFWYATHIQTLYDYQKNH
ncbi:MAG: DUF255 domain-containing protein [Gammaproteobacteria bacterium]|nr:DUF255 domain-containing protein [Gammaproteobacteria bacterium]